MMVQSRLLTVLTAALFWKTDPGDERDAVPFPFPIHNLALLGIRNTLFVFAGVGIWWLILSRIRLVRLLG